MEQLLFTNTKIGTEIYNSKHTITFLEILMYGAATWNMYLLHLDREFAKKKGFRDVNIAAPHFGALLSKMLVQVAGNPTYLKNLKYQVKVMGFPGDTLNFGGVVVKKYQKENSNLVDCDIWIKNQENIKIVIGSATISLLP